MKVLLIHDEMLNPTLPIFEAYPDLVRVFVFDPDFIAEQGWQLRRLQFMADALSSIPNVRLFKGKLLEVLALIDSESSVQVVTQSTPNTEILAWLGTLDHVEFVQGPEFVNYKGPVSRFTKYWKTVQGQWFPKT